jgi:hypothetical protein
MELLTGLLRKERGVSEGALVIVPLTFASLPSRISALCKEVCPFCVKRRSGSDEPIHASTKGEMDCFAEPVVGRAFARPVGLQ